MEDLYDYQEAVLKADDLRAKVLDIAKESALPKLKNDFNRAKELLKSLNDDFHQKEQIKSDLETEVATRQSYVADLNKKLYDGEITNPRELQDLQSKALEEENFLISLEDELSRATYNLTEAEEKRYRTAVKLKKIQKKFHATAEAVKKEQDALKEELEKTEALATKLRDCVPAELLAIYDKEAIGLKKRVAVPLIRQNVCSGCYCAVTDTQVKKVKENGELVRCQSCNRLLFQKEDGDE